ncbi:TIM barrel protein [Pseudomonas sp. NPDC007930]|uniref:sugar phosphate isomerase/epimerase family protein n=1 Tax=Pseudomonas sp. NPDC007930 TaxID=3364417 RepID=UPI0036E8F9E9
MKLGWCGPLDSARDMAAAGLDYIEVQLVPLNLENDSAFAEAKARITDLPLPALASSYLFPKDFRILGPGTDERRNRAYFERVVELLGLAGTQVVVLGSGWTRNIPDGWSRAQAEDGFAHTLAWCADTLAGSGTTLVIEPLNRKESNLVNSVAEGVQLAQRVNRAEVRGLADFYHMDEEHEPLAEVGAYPGWLGHVHLADSGRFNPGTGHYDYTSFFGHLQRGGYSGLLSGECSLKGDPVEAMRASARFLRHTWNTLLQH